MSRITGREVSELMEAYASIYAPEQEVVEEETEQIDEDLIGDVLSNRGKIKSAATRAITATNRAASATNRALGSAVSDTARQVKSGVKQTAKDVATGYKYGGTTGAAAALGANIVRGIATSGQPAKPAAAKPAPAKPSTPAPTAAKPSTPAPTAAKPSTPAPTAAKPSTPAPAKPAPSGQTGDKAKDMATWAKANPTLANKPKTANPLMQKTFGYQTGNAPDQIAKASAGAPPTPSGSALGAAAKPEVRKALNLPAKPSAAPEVKQTAAIAATPKPTPVAPGYQGAKKPFAEEVDAYDLVLDYLLENGHVDTLDEAHYVMLEMDSEMIQNIAEAKRKSYSAKKARKGEDLGLPGPGFEKITKEAGKRYGSKKRGEKVAGAVLAGLRAKYGK